jgi:hypothetical protein
MTRGYPKASLSKKQAELTLTSLLFGCTEERLAGFTAESLRASYNVPLAKVEELLARARRSRAA